MVIKVYRFHQDDIDIVICNNTVMVTFKNTTRLFKLRKDIDIDRELEVFPEKFREFAKKQIMKALHG